MMSVLAGLLNSLK